MLLTEICAAAVLLEADGGHGAQHLGDALACLLQTGLGVGLAGDGGHEICLQVQIAVVGPLLGGRLGHGPHPVAEGGGVVEVLVVDAVGGQLCLVFVDGRVGLGLVVAALAEEVLHDLLGHLVGCAGAGLADDLVDHAVSIIHQIVQHANLPCLCGAVVVGEAVVHQVGVGGTVGAVQPALGQAELFHHGQRTLCDDGQVALAVSHAADELHLPAGVTGLFPCPGQGVVLFLADVLGGLLTGHPQDPQQVTVQVAVVVPQAHVIDGMRPCQIDDHGAVALVLEVVDAVRVDAGAVQHGHTGVGVVGGQVVIGQRVYIILGVAADGAGGAAAVLHGVLRSGSAKIEVALEAAQSHLVDVVVGLLAGIHGAAGSLFPHTARCAGPAVLAGGGAVLGPALGLCGDVVVVVAADEVAHHVVGQLQHLLGVGDLDAAGAADGQALQLLVAHGSAQTGAAGVAKAGVQGGVVHQILTGRADGSGLELTAVLLHHPLVGRERTLAPDVRSILEGDLVVLDAQVDGLCGDAGDDDAVPARILQHGANVAAHVGVDDGTALGPGGAEGDVHAAGAGHAGTGQGADAEDDLCLLVVGVEVHGSFLIHDAVGHAHTADILMVLCVILRGDLAGGQVNAQDLACPAIIFSHCCSSSLQVHIGSLCCAGDGIPVHDGQSAGRAACHAGTAGDALGRLAGLGVDGGHMPGAGLVAGAAADALVGVHHADALLVGRNGLLGAGVAAGGVLALAAGIREVDKAVVVAGQQAVAGTVQIQTALDLHTADVRGAHTIVGQRAVDLAALAAGTQVGVDHQQALGQRPGSHCAAVHLLLRAAEEGQHGCGEGEPCKALARDLHKLTAGHVSRQKISFCHRFHSSVEVTLRGAPQLHRNTSC